MTLTGSGRGRSITSEATIAPPTPPRYCPFCKSATEGRRFCPGCGHYVLADLGDPHDAESNDDAARPSIWSGAVIAIAGVLAVLGSFQPWVEIPAYRDYVGSEVDAMTWSGVDNGMKEHISVGIGAQGAVTVAVGLLMVLLGIAVASGRSSQLRARLGALPCILVLAWVVQTGISRVDAFNQQIPGAEEPRLTLVGIGITIVGLAAVVALVGVFIPARDVD